MPQLPCHRRAADDIFGRPKAVSEAQQQSAGGAQRPLPETAGDVAAMDVDTRREMCVRCSRLLATAIADRFILANPAVRRGRRDCRRRKDSFSRRRAWSAGVSILDVVMSAALQWLLSHHVQGRRSRRPGPCTDSRQPAQGCLRRSSGAAWHPLSVGLAIWARHLGVPCRNAICWRVGRSVWISEHAQHPAPTRVSHLHTNTERRLCFINFGSCSRAPDTSLHMHCRTGTIVREASTAGRQRQMSQPLRLTPARHRRRPRLLAI